ncbi:MAG TPA: hypothetical protein VHQ47_17800 [Phycisphaerae bacterium]|nr:hypothetical protein [Phycisphaerae bacterium]
MAIFKKKIIFGCESRGDADSVYLTRYTLLSAFGRKLCLHIFHRSDADELHDHPWSFWTFIIWRGYLEHTPAGVRRVWPLTLHRRPATWRHRVELVGGKAAVTLVLLGRPHRIWGFWTTRGWVNWIKYFRDRGC